MKKIDLLIKIANGEEPKIKYNNFILKYNKNEKRFIDKDRLNSLYEIDFSELNDEIEIIEEDKEIKKSDFQYSEIPPYFDLTEVIKSCNNNFEKHQKAINKILDYLMEEK